MSTSTTPFLFPLVPLSRTCLALSAMLPEYEFGKYCLLISGQKLKCTMQQKQKQQQKTNENFML